LGFLASILLSLAAKPKAGSENPSTTLRTNLSQPEPIAMNGSFQNVPPGDNNCPLIRVVNFEVLQITFNISRYHLPKGEIEKSPPLKEDVLINCSDFFKPIR